MTDEYSDDGITRDYRILQRRRGHRYSIDDVVTAYHASQLLSSGSPALAVDLGCGIGSVILMVAWRHPQSRWVGIEAQATSWAIGRRNIARNGLNHRVQLIHGDLRSLEVPVRLGAGRYDLVTGTPPYKPLGTATPSTDPQRAYARVEFRGGVEDYLKTANRLVHPDGFVVVCAEAGAPARVADTATQLGLHPYRHQAVYAREGKPSALFEVWVLGQRDRGFEELAPLYGRDREGRRTADERRIRRYFLD